MATYPEVQKRAQAELDTIVGPHRLPTIEDEKLLPYVSALVKECLRWRLVAPLGLAHRSTEEDEYKGYRIPKGSVVVPNIWYVSVLMVAFLTSNKEMMLTDPTRRNLGPTLGISGIMRTPRSSGQSASSRMVKLTTACLTPV